MIVMKNIIRNVGRHIAAICAMSYAVAYMMASIKTHYTPGGVQYSFRGESLSLNLRAVPLLLLTVPAATSLYLRGSIKNGI